MGPEPKAGLTLDEHRDLSRELLRTQRRLDEFATLAVGIYGPESRASIAFAEAAEAVGRLRFLLKNQAADDCPGDGAGELYS
jgi:hypothetical protein